MVIVHMDMEHLLALEPIQTPTILIIIYMPSKMMQAVGATIIVAMIVIIMALPDIHTSGKMPILLLPLILMGLMRKLQAAIE